MTPTQDESNKANKVRTCVLTARQHEMLAIFGRRTEPVEFSDVWDSYTFGDPSGPLAMSNFSRVGDALLRHGLIARDVADEALITITDAGREVLTRKAAPRPPRAVDETSMLAMLDRGAVPP